MEPTPCAAPSMLLGREMPPLTKPAGVAALPMRRTGPIRTSQCPQHLDEHLSTLMDIHRQPASLFTVQHGIFGCSRESEESKRKEQQGKGKKATAMSTHGHCVKT